MKSACPTRIRLSATACPAGLETVACVENGTGKPLDLVIKSRTSETRFEAALEPAIEYCLRATPPPMPKGLAIRTGVEGPPGFSRWDRGYKTSRFMPTDNHIWSLHEQ